MGVIPYIYCPIIIVESYAWIQRDRDVVKREFIPSSYRSGGFNYFPWFPLRKGGVFMRLSTRKIVMSGILGAVSILLGLTGLGFIPVPTPAGNATIMHLPVILGGVLEGPMVGLLTGFIFGIFSFIRAGNPIFADPLVAILPRLFIGLVSFLVYFGLKRFNENVSLITAGVLGSFTNTILVMLMAVIRGYLPYEVALSITFVHGVPEAVVAALLVLVLVRGIKGVRRSSEFSG